ncbi:protein IQ-DOMAIN 33-like isoform X2 [Phragmites australis]|nr:protein IQ-DOMAIN 33-like isoform X2 [Phragmites australis]
MTQEAHVQVVQPSDVRNADDNPGEPADQRIPGEHSHVVPAEPVGKEEAATLIQSAFRGLTARKQLQELKGCKESRGRTDENRSFASASVAASVQVQVGESLSDLRLSEDSASVQQRASQKSRPPPVFRVKEEWDDSTVSSNVSRMRIQSRIEATTRRERALAYAFSQQLRSCGGTKKRSARPDQAELNVGWSWLERWMATRQAEQAADDCMSRNTDSGSARRVVVIRRRHDLAVEEKESCGSNDVSLSAVSFDGSSGGMLSCHKQGGRNRLKGARNLPRRKVASSDHRLQARSHKVSKKGHQREEELHKDQAETDGFDAWQPPTDY